MKRIDVALLLLQDRDLLNEHMEGCFYILDDGLKELEYYIGINGAFTVSSIPGGAKIDTGKIYEEFKK